MNLQIGHGAASLSLLPRWSDTYTAPRRVKPLPQQTALPADTARARPPAPLGIRVLWAMYLVLFVGALIRMLTAP